MSGIEREPTVIARTVTRIVVPLILVTAIALLLQGHNRPGGGFIAGVLTATAFALTYVIYGLDFIRQDLLARPTPIRDVADVSFAGSTALIFGFGLALAAGSGVAAMTFGYPFLTQAVVFVRELPIYHELEFASALAFDLGVYFVVVGALLAILAVVGHE
ncbi:MAG: MnhB domain-containing protein [Haloarculaceae archaeon]